MPLSIRWRLTLWNTLALALVLSCFAALVYGLLRRALLEQTDRLLAAGSALLRDDPRIATSTDQRIRHWVEEFKDHQGLYCAIYRGDGLEYARTPGLEEASVPPALAQAAGRAPHELDLPGIGRQRVLAQRLLLAGREYILVLLAPLAAVDAQLAQVRTVLFTAGPLALLLCGGFGYVLARQALAPIDELTRATESIGADQLDRRLSVPNPDDELGRLAQTINAMMARLQRAFAEVRRFTADASHELRTPLAILRSEIEVALSQPAAARAQQPLLAGLLEELERLTRLTDQLLTLSRRDAGVEHFRTAMLDLNALVAGVVDALRPVAEARGIRLNFEAAGCLEMAGDDALLRQVFINVLDNALKYTGAGGTVTVRVQQQDERSVVVVADTGIGIAAEHLPRVFERFFRVDKARSRAEGGTGLGLSLAQSTILAHGGSIGLASDPGRGTICTVVLPRRTRMPVD